MFDFLDGFIRNYSLYTMIRRA
jgi:hypothetical protein